MSGAINGTTPASTILWANSGECLDISAKVQVTMRFNDSSGS